MSKRDKVLTALGGVLGAAAYLILVFGFHYWLHIDPKDTPRFLLGLALSAALGCMGGLATRPFSDDGWALVRNSLLH